MKHGQPALSIFVKEGEGRTRRFVGAREALDQAFDEVRFPRPEIADERNNVVRHERLRPIARESNRFGPAIGNERSHGRNAEAGSRKPEAKRRYE